MPRWSRAGRGARARRRGRCASSASSRGFVFGGAFGAFSAITFEWHVAIAIGLALFLGIAPAVAAAFAASGGIDIEAIKARFMPQATIDTTKETLEWAKVADARRGRVVTGPVAAGEPPIPDPATAASTPTSSVALAVLAGRPDVLAARAAARASRTDMEEELVRLEAAARAALDVKAKVKRNPARVAGAAAGVGFLAIGGPRKVLRGARNAVFGKPDPLPEAMLPEEIEKALKALGPDGAKVRGALEREFASYVAKTEPQAAGPALDARVPAATHGPRPDLSASAASSSRRSSRRRPALLSRWRRCAPVVASRARGRLLRRPLGPDPGDEGGHSRDAARYATLAAGRVAEWQTRRP